MTDDNPCSNCGAVGLHECPHQQILRCVEQTQIHERELREARDRDLDRPAREFWERAALSLLTIPWKRDTSFAELGDSADDMLDEWRKRFDPKEGA